MKIMKTALFKYYICVAAFKMKVLRAQLCGNFSASYKIQGVYNRNLPISIIT